MKEKVGSKDAYCSLLNLMISCHLFTLPVCNMMLICPSRISLTSARHYLRSATADFLIAGREHIS